MKRAALWLMLTLSACSREDARPSEPTASAVPSPSVTTRAPAPFALPKLLFMPKLKTPKRNPLTAEKIALGKTLFFDKKLGSHFACVGCHKPDRGWADGIALSKRASGRENTRNTPSLYNVGYQVRWGWDGRSPTLEAQVREEWATQLAIAPATATAAIASDAGYDPLFLAAFGSREITEQRIVDALASFVRSIRSGNAPYDRFENGDKTAMSESAQRGWLVFRDKGGCTACHVPPLFTDNRFHNIGVGYGPGATSPDPGREDVTDQKRDRGAFKTPTLRSAVRTAPYFHDGSAATVEAAVDYVLTGGHDNPQRDTALTKLELTPEQRADLLAFIRALDGTP